MAVLGSRPVISFFLGRSILCKNNILLLTVLSPCPVVSIVPPTQWHWPVAACSLPKGKLISLKPPQLGSSRVRRRKIQLHSIIWQGWGQCWLSPALPSSSVLCCTGEKQEEVFGESSAKSPPTSHSTTRLFHTHLPQLLLAEGVLSFPECIFPEVVNDRLSPALQRGWGGTHHVHPEAAPEVSAPQQCLGTCSK